MPQKKVYGKKPAATLFKSADFFSTKSPQVRRRVKCMETTDGKPCSNNRSSPAQQPRIREPLGTLDLNARLEALSLEDKIVASKHVLKSTRAVAPSATIKVHGGEETSTEGIEQTPPLRLKQNRPENQDPELRQLLELASENPVAPQPFEDWSAEVEANFNVTKIAEATYGEVYRLKFNRPTECSPEGAPYLESVLKIIALKPSDFEGRKISKAQKERETNMSTIQSVVSELRLLRRMATIPGFVNLRGVRVVQGRPPNIIARAWRAFNQDLIKEKGETSEFADPSKKSSYLASQLWAIIEVQDAGTDLERVHLPTVFHVWDVFWGVALSLGKAEAECRFEHRDLHLGNICVQLGHEETNVDTMQADMAVRNVTKSTKLHFTNLKTTIIDYTLS